jgi:hypothetical protein
VRPTHWLRPQALAARTRGSYRRAECASSSSILSLATSSKGLLARDREHDRRAVLGDWRRRLVDHGLAPSTLNLALAAATSVLDSMAPPEPRVPRIEIDPGPPRALTPLQPRETRMADPNPLHGDA